MKNASKIKWILIISFVVSIFVVSIVQAFIDMGNGGKPQCLDLFLYKPTQGNLRTFESELENNSWFSHTLQPWMRLAQFAILNDLGDKVLMGGNGWFFYRPGVRYLIEPMPETLNSKNSTDDIMSAILDFRDQLKSRNIHLMVVIAPGKESIYPDWLNPSIRFKNQFVFTHTSKIISALQKKDIEVIDLYHLFLQKRISQTEHPALYLSQDTHWSPYGIQVASKHMAQKILDLKRVKKGEFDYRLKPITIKRHGDLLRMVEIPFMDQLYEEEVISCTQVISAETNEPLKDDPNAQILILGDSFLRIFERDEPGAAGLTSHLAYELQQPLSSIISDGGASTLVRQQLAQKTDLLNNKKIVIWEFVDRDIRFGTEGWQKVTLR